MKKRRGKMPSRKKMEIRKSFDKQYFWVIVGSNGQDMGQSETMHNLQDCIDSAMSIMKNNWEDSDLEKVF